MREVYDVQVQILGDHFFFPPTEGRFPKLVGSLQSQGSNLVLLEFFWQRRPGPLSRLGLIGLGK